MADHMAEARRIIDLIDREFAAFCAEREREERPRARILGDPNNNSVELPARRGRKGVLIAKTCIECGELRMAADYRLTGHSRSPDPRCRLCLNAKHAYRPDWWLSYGPRARAADGEANARTLETATRYGQQWTGAELEIALRADLTATRAAEMLGRTKYAVQTIRKRHKQEPMLQRVAGVAG